MRILASSSDVFLIKDDSAYSCCIILHIHASKCTNLYWTFELNSFHSRKDPPVCRHLYFRPHARRARVVRRAETLYIGDSFYGRVAKDSSYEQAIILLKRGIGSTTRTFVRDMASICGRDNEEPARGPVRIGCGHTTSFVEGLECLLVIQQLIQDTAARVPIEDCNEKRGEIFGSVEAGWKVKTIRRVAPKGCAWAAN